jgi:cytoskeletal protein CcmA (bactofilin family)
VIGAEATLRGDIRSSGAVVIAGCVHGEVFSDVKIEIVEGGQVEGQLHAPEILVDGKLVGDAHATVSIGLGGRGEVRGDISTPSILIASGATFVGRCSMPANAA